MCVCCVCVLAGVWEFVYVSGDNFRHKSGVTAVCAGAAGTVPAKVLPLVVPVSPLLERWWWSSCWFLWRSNSRHDTAEWFYNHRCPCGCVAVASCRWRRRRIITCRRFLQCNATTPVLSSRCKGFYALFFFFVWIIIVFIHSFDNSSVTDHPHKVIIFISIIAYLGSVPTTLAVVCFRYRSYKRKIDVLGTEPYANETHLSSSQTDTITHTHTHKLTHTNTNTNTHTHVHTYTHA